VEENSVEENSVEENSVEENSVEGSPRRLKAAGSAFNIKRFSSYLLMFKYVCNKIKN